MVVARFENIRFVKIYGPENDIPTVDDVILKFVKFYRYLALLKVQNGIFTTSRSNAYKFKGHTHVLYAQCCGNDRDKIK